MEVGRISARLDAIFDDAGFDRFDRRVRAARNDSRREVTQKLDSKYDGKGFDQFDKASDRAHKSHTRLIGVVGKSGAALRAVGTGAAAGAVGLGLLGKTAIGTASDINESLAKNQVLFGKHAKGIDAWSKETASALGVSRQQALESTGTFGNLFTALDIAPKKSADMSKGLVKLAADMASFNNASPEETLEAIRSGLVGETEPLRKFGVNMNDAALRTEALRLGLVKNTKEALDPQAKALAANALITKQTAAAHGDFARTSGGLANQGRILRARLSDVSAELGAKLLPAAVKVVSGINKIIDVFSGAEKQSKRTEGAMAGVRGAVTKVGDVFRSIFRFIGRVINDNQDNVDGFKRNIQNLAGAVSRLLSRIADAFRDTFGGNSGTTRSIRQIIHAVGQIIVAVQGVLTYIVRSMVPGISQVFRGAFTVIRGAVRLIAGILTGDFRKAWAGVKDIFGGALKAVAGLLRAATAPFRKGASDIWHAMEDTLDKGWATIKRKSVDFINDVIGILNKIPGVHIGKIGQVTDQGGTGNRPSDQGGVGHPQRLAEGGKITSPIVLMGEEAPTHPEWVIPTNPAYRQRAISLWMASARELGIPGFRQGGFFSQKEMEQLWARHGGGDTQIAGAVGMAESGGDPNAANGPYHGLWQIGPGGPFDPDANAAAGVSKWRASGWQPWEAYTGPDGKGSDGNFRKFMGGSLLGDVWGGIKGAAGGAFDLVGDLLGRLPKLPNLPGWIKPALSNALGKAKDYIRDKAGGIFGGGGDTSTTGLIPQVKRALSFARSHGWGGSVQSGFRSDAEQLRIWNSGIRPAAKPRALGGAGSNHSTGQAVDVSDPAGFERAMALMGAGRLYARVPSDPIHFSVTGYKKGGKRPAKKKGPPKPILDKPDAKGINRSLARGERGITKYESRIQNLERDYGQLDRRFGLSEEDWVVEHDDGSITIDTDIKDKRVKELDALIRKRRQIKREIDRYRAAITRLIGKLQEAVAVLRSALARAKGKARKKERAGYREAIGDHRTRIGELRGVFGDLSQDVEDAGIDLEELRGERATVQSATGQGATPTEAETPGEAGEATPPETSPNVQAMLDEANTLNAGLRADIKTAQQNFAVFRGPGDIGVGGYANALAAATMGGRAVGTEAINAPVTASGSSVWKPGSDNITVEVRSFVPPSPAEAAKLGRAVVQGLDAATARRGDVRELIP